jgi:hypothetical protein
MAHADRHTPSAVQVTLIDQSDRFVFKPLLYELLTGAASEDEVAPSFNRLLAPYPITFLQGKVAAVQPKPAKEVRAFLGWPCAVTCTGLAVFCMMVTLPVWAGVGLARCRAP